MQHNFKIKRTLGIISLLCMISLGANAQMESEHNHKSDTLLVKSEVKVHSPHKATMYAAILPGLGHAYNKKYWKIPIVYTAFGISGYAIWFNSTNYQTYKNAYRDFIIQDPNNKSYLDVLPPSLDPSDVEEGGSQAAWFEDALNNQKQYYKKWRDISYVSMALIYTLNIIWANVDAHFKTFDISDDLSFRVEPVAVPPSINYASNNTGSMGVSIKFIF